MGTKARIFFKEMFTVNGLLGFK